MEEKKIFDEIQVLSEIQRGENRKLMIALVSSKNFHRIAFFNYWKNKDGEWRYGKGFALRAEHFIKMFDTLKENESRIYDYLLKRDQGIEK